MNKPTSSELEQAIEDIGYAILQACLAHDLYFFEVIPVPRKNGMSEETIKIVNNASLESQLLFLRKLNEFFEPLPAKKEDDLRAEHYFGFKSPGRFLSDQDVTELHKRVGHITLSEAVAEKTGLDLSAARCQVQLIRRSNSFASCVYRISSLAQCEKTSNSTSRCSSRRKAVSIPNPQQLLPLPEIALEAHALGGLRMNSVEAI